MPSKRTHPYYDTPVCKLLRGAIAASDRPLIDTARRVGYENTHMLSMVQHGTAKLPMAKAMGLAKALKIEPTLLIDAAIRSYPNASSWQVLRMALEDA